MGTILYGNLKGDFSYGKELECLFAFLFAGKSFFVAYIAA